MAKYAAAEAAVHAVDQAVQSLGGNGLTKEYGIAAMLAMSRVEPDRAGEPRDDAQLRRAARPAAAPLLLTRQHPRPENDDDVRAAHPHQRVPAGRDPLDARSTRPCWPVPPHGVTTRRWSTA